MKLYRSKGSIWTGTQADAKAAQGGTDFEAIEVPVDKPSLIAWLNANVSAPTGAETIPETPAAPEPETPTISTNPEQMRPSQMERFEAVARKLGWSPPGTEPETPAAPAAPKVPLYEQILDLTPKELAPVLSAAIGRLGEVAGNNGWGVFAKDVYSWTPGARSVEQGLGMLMLAAFDQLGEKK